MRTALNILSPELPLVLLGMIALAVGGSPARAAPRDQVMSKAFGCAGIGEARLWLDCYYGAAQSVRAALGLPPATAAQITLADSPPAGSAPQAADIRHSVLSDAADCGEGNDDHKWLDCYYASAQPMRAYLNLSAAPRFLLPKKNGDAGAPGLSISDPAPGNPNDQFGLGNGASRVRSVTARMSVYKFDSKGDFTVTLANGETWRQLSGDTSFAQWKGDARQFVVRVSRGFLGSYNLQVRNSPGMYKVRRIQ